MVMRITEPCRNGVADLLRGRPDGFVVQPEHRLIYMKPAKTGGTSVFRKVLEPQIGGFLYTKGDRATFFEWLHAITDEALRDYYIFVTVRHPIDRFISLANYFRLPVSQLLRQPEMLEGETDLGVHARAQVSYSHIAGRPFVNAICRMETLEDDIKAVLSDMRLPGWGIPHVNKSRRMLSNWRISKGQQRAIADLYEKDFAPFGYEMPC